MTTEIKPARQLVTTIDDYINTLQDTVSARTTFDKPDFRRHLGMAWRRRVTIFWNAWLTLITLGMRKP